MSVTKYELDVKCQAIEAGMDARVQRIESKVDTAVVNIGLLAEHIKLDNKQIRNEMHEIRTDLKNTKWQVLFLCLTLLGLVAGFLSITNSWQQNNISMLTSRMDKVESHMDKIDTHMSKIDNTLDSINAKLTKAGM